MYIYVYMIDLKHKLRNILLTEEGKKITQDVQY